jgi:hypothetical protein
VDSRACGAGGTETRTCDALCRYGAFGPCEQVPECAAGAVETDECGQCGTRSRTCGPNGRWGAFGACGGEGVCAPGEVQDCAGACWRRARVGNGFCDDGTPQPWGDSNFDCAAFGFDGGDCPIPDTALDTAFPPFTDTGVDTALLGPVGPLGP